MRSRPSSLHRKKINLSTVFAGQAVGLKEVKLAQSPISFFPKAATSSLTARVAVCN